MQVAATSVIRQRRASTRRVKQTLLATAIHLSLSAVAGMALLCFIALALGAQMPTRELAFVSKALDGSEDIYLSDANRGRWARLTHTAFPKLQPVWSPDGRLLAFSGRAWRGLHETGLYLLDTTTRELRQLISGPVDYLPSWSADGAELAFVTRERGQYSLYAADSATGALRRLTSKANQIAFPTWSPDGSALAYVVVFGADDGLYVVSADGSREVRLTEWIAFTPAWSPDSREIVFTAPNSGNSEVYVIDVATGAMRNVSRNPAYDSDPVWSPDGTRIAFYSLRECNEISLYVVDADGSNQRRLLDNCALSMRGTSDNRPPAWSPDGTRIALTSQDGRALNIYTVQVDSGDIWQLTNFEAIVKYPAWRP